MCGFVRVCACERERFGSRSQARWHLSWRKHVPFSHPKQHREMPTFQPLVAISSLTLRINTEEIRPEFYVSHEGK